MTVFRHLLNTSAVLVAPPQLVQRTPVAGKEGRRCSGSFVQTLQGKAFPIVTKKTLLSHDKVLDVNRERCKAGALPLVGLNRPELQRVQIRIRLANGGGESAHREDPTASAVEGASSIGHFETTGREVVA